MATNLIKWVNKWLTIPCGVGAVVYMAAEFGLSGFITAWVLMHFGAVWRPRMEAWIETKRTEAEENHVN